MFCILLGDIINVHFLKNIFKGPTRIIFYIIYILQKDEKTQLGSLYKDLYFLVFKICCIVSGEAIYVNLKWGLMVVDLFLYITEWWKGKVLFQNKK